MKNICLEISYDGTEYSGFQSQPNGNTVQDKLEEAIFRLTREKPKVISSGRTDAGVHAKSQWINFHTNSQIPINRWRMALNTNLPEDIAALSAYEVPMEFHARRHARKKTYRYSINTMPSPDVFRRRFEYHLPVPLWVGRMREAASWLIGTHDFTSFCSARTILENKVRTIYELRIEASSDDAFRGRIELFVTGSGFLYNMVRIIAGTLIEVGKGKRKPADLAQIRDSKDRTRAGLTAPAHGLTLWRVEYDAQYNLSGRLDSSDIM